MEGMQNRWLGSFGGEDKGEGLLVRGYPAVAEGLAIPGRPLAAMAHTFALAKVWGTRDDPTQAKIRLESTS